MFARNQVWIVLFQRLIIAGFLLSPEEVVDLKLPIAGIIGNANLSLGSRLKEVLYVHKRPRERG